MSELPANWGPPEKPRTEEEEKRRRSLVPIGITIGIAFVLMAGSAFGALATCSFSEKNPSSDFFAGATMFFFAILVLSVFWLIVSLVIRKIEDWRSGARE